MAQDMQSESMTTETLLQQHFERCKPYLVDALKKNNGEITLEQVWERIKGREYLFLPGEKSAIVLEPFTHASGKKVMNFFLAGGDLEELKEMESQASSAAKQMGFHAMAIFGRRGWVRALDGYKETAVLMEKTL